MMSGEDARILEQNMRKSERADRVKKLIAQPLLAADGKPMRTGSFWNALTGVCSNKRTLIDERHANSTGIGAISSYVVTSLRRDREDDRKKLLDDVKAAVAAVKAKSEAKLPFLSIIYGLLCLDFGKTTPHSFKFKMLARLYGLTTADESESEELVACFIEEIKKKRLEAYQPYIEKMLAHISDISHETFVKRYMQVEHLCRRHPPYGIKENVAAKKISILDAMHECLLVTTSKGKKHSFGFLLLLSFFDVRLPKGSTIVTSTKDIEGNVTNHYNYSCFLDDIELPSVLSKELKLILAAYSLNVEVELLTDGLMQAIRERQQRAEADAMIMVNDKLKTCAAEGTVKPVHLVEKLTNLMQANEDKKASLTGLSFLASMVVAITKDLTRNNDIKELIVKLNAGTISVIDALYTFLNGIGSKGPHSHKYSLLKNLFLLDDLGDNEIASAAMIDRFVRGIDERRQQAPKAQFNI